MNAAGVPTKAELQAYSLGKLDPQRAAEVEAYVEAHPERLDELKSADDDEVVRHLRRAGELLPPPRPPLLALAIEAVLPVVAGCAGALAAGAEGGLVGVAVGQVAEKAINVFGARIIARWLEWLRRQSPAERAAALAQLADVPPEAARCEAAAVLESQAPQASEADRRAAADYLGAIPRAVRQSLLSDRAGVRSLSPSVSVEDSLSLLQLMPVSLPPYAVPCVLPGTSYQLEELIGCGGLGAVYRASVADMQNLPLAIKFCLDRSLTAVLRREQANLERLRVAGGESWSPRIARLYGYNLEHPTPYLVYEYVSGGDLAQWLARRRLKTGAELTPNEVLSLMVQVVEGLAFAHERGIVHRDLKPANVLVCNSSPQPHCRPQHAGGPLSHTGERGSPVLLPPLPSVGEGGWGGEGVSIKLADFGIGAVAQQMALTSRIGTTVDALSPAEQASLFRGAGTPLYADPEQKEGKAPDPRHDLYSLGVTWYQLLVGDVRREMRHGWERELERRHAVPREHVELIGRCVGWVEDRPKDAGELRKLLAQGTAVEDLPKPAAVARPVEQPPKTVAQAEAQKWREDVVRAVTALEIVSVPNEMFIGLAVLSLVLGLPAIVFGSLGAMLYDKSGVFCPLAFLLAVVAFVCLLWSGNMERRRRNRQATARSELVACLGAAQAALSLTPPLVGQDGNSLSQVGWKVVYEIEDRYLTRGARLRMRFAIPPISGAGGFMSTVYLNGAMLGKMGVSYGVELSADLCCGSHYLVVDSTSAQPMTGRGVVVLPGEGSYHAEIHVQRTLRPKVAPLFHDEGRA